MFFLKEYFQIHFFNILKCNITHAFPEVIFLGEILVVYIWVISLNLYHASTLLFETEGVSFFYDKNRSVTALICCTIIFIFGSVPVPHNQPSVFENNSPLVSTVKAVNRMSIWPFTLTCIIVAALCFLGNWWWAIWLVCLVIPFLWGTWGNKYIF